MYYSTPKMTLWGFNLCGYLSADNLLNIYTAHSTHDIWALYNSSVIWWRAIIIFRHGKRHRGSYLHSLRTIGCHYNSFQNSIFCLTISNVCPASTHSQLTCFSRNLSSLSVWLYVNLTLRFLYTVPVKCKSEPALKTKISHCSKCERVESVFWGYLSPCSGGNWKPREF